MTFGVQMTDIFFNLLNLASTSRHYVANESTCHYEALSEEKTEGKMFCEEECCSSLSENIATRKFYVMLLVKDQK